MVPRVPPPASEKLGDKRAGIALDDAGGFGEIIEKEDGGLADVDALIGEVFSRAVLARIAQPSSARGADEEAHNPVGEGRAEQEQVPSLQLAKKRFEIFVAALLDERAEVFHIVLLPDGEVREGVEPPENVIDERRGERIGEGRGGFCVVGEHIARAGEAGAGFLHRQPEERIEGAGDEKIEVRDLGELDKGGGGSKRASRKRRRRPL